jgi:AcrR family transcriptional regulator
MDGKPTRVKKSSRGKRPYDTSRRLQQAARNRTAVIDSAAQRFLRDGYTTTTISSIAADVGVSDHTIYKSFGGKAGLIRAVRERALEGTGPVPAEQRSDDLHDSDHDGRSIIEAWGALTSEVMPRVAPVLLLVRDASVTDPEVAELLTELDAERLQRMRVNAERLHTGGHLRNGLSVDATADVLWTYSAPELYELLVLRHGWSVERYALFVADAMIGALL